MKRIISILTVLSLLFVLASCGKKAVKPEDKEVDDSAMITDGKSVVYADELETGESDEGKAANTTKTQVSARSLLTYFYNGSYNTGKTGKHIGDFDGDGTEEMIVSEYKVSEYNTIVSCNLYLYTVSGGVVRLNDTYEVSNETFSDYKIFMEINEENKDGWLEHYKQYAESWVNKNGVISMNITNRFQGVSVNYFLIKASDGELSIKQHLLDPGYSSGTGLYYYDGYTEDLESVMLYENEGIEGARGKYASYAEALNDLIGAYGFGFEENSKTGKYSVKQADGMEMINSFNTF